MFEPENEFLKKIYNYRWSINKGDTKFKETPEFWSKLAVDYVKKVHSKEGRKEIEKLLNRFNWSSEESVLDLGAGPGSYAIPLAKKVKLITSLDPSPVMIKLLKEQAEKENVTNINTITDRWLDANNIEKHDTVISMNSLGMLSISKNGKSRLDKALIKMKNKANKRIIILIPHADSPADKAMREAVGISGVPSERKKIAALYYAMVDCGMLPNLNIITRPFRWVFKGLDDACETLSVKLGLTDKIKQDKLREHLKGRLVKDGKIYKLSYDCKQALFYWEK